MRMNAVCRMLQPGQQVRIVNLVEGADGQVGSVVGLCQGGGKNAAIMPSGYWTVAFPDPANRTPLHRDIQRNHLQIVKRKK